MDMKRVLVVGVGILVGTAYFYWGTRTTYIPGRTIWVEQPYVIGLDCNKAYQFVSDISNKDKKFEYFQDFKEVSGFVSRREIWGGESFDTTRAWSNVYCEGKTTGEVVMTGDPGRAEVIPSMEVQNVDAKLLLRNEILIGGIMMGLFFIFPVFFK